MNLEELKKTYPEKPIGRARDLTNKKFGYLTALYRTENKGKSASPRWVCQCECGNIKDYLSQNLFKGEPSCGCKNREKASIRMFNYNLNQQSIHIGDKFGKLTVLEYDGLKKQNSRDKNESWYICKCECGNIKSIRGNQLKTGHTLSCGCISSIGEFKIEQLLKENNIKYKKEFIFSDCLNTDTNKPFRFDFAIFDNDNFLYLIEFDGRQHYYGPDTTTWTHSIPFEEIKKRDKIKNEYCIKHNIPLIRIPYTHYEDLKIEDLLLNTTTFKI